MESNEVQILCYCFLVSVLYFTIYFSIFFYFTPYIFTQISVLLLLTFSNQSRYFNFGGSPFDNKSIKHHESVILDWQHDSARSTSPPRGFCQSNQCKRLENGVGQRGKTADLFMIQVQVSFICK